MLVSCIMATYNRRQFIPVALSSFLGQTLIDSELIIIDDGTDLIKDLIPLDSRIQYIQLPTKRHFCIKRDIGLRCAIGKYIAVWDDDDLFAPERLEYQIRALEACDKPLCLLSTALAKKDNQSWLYQPADLYHLDNSAVFKAIPAFSFYSGEGAGGAVRALRETFGRNLVAIGGFRLLTIGIHDTNIIRRVGNSSEWTEIP